MATLIEIARYDNRVTVRYNDRDGVTKIVHRIFPQAAFFARVVKAIQDNKRAECFWSSEDGNFLVYTVYPSQGTHDEPEYKCSAYED